MADNKKGHEKLFSCPWPFHTGRRLSTFTAFFQMWAGNHRAKLNFFQPLHQLPESRQMIEAAGLAGVIQIMPDLVDMIRRPQLRVEFPPFR